MAKAAVSIRGFGDRALSRSLQKFDGKVQKKLVRRTTKESARRLKRYGAAGLSKHIDTGELIAAWLALPVGPLRRKASVQGHGVARLPTAKLAIRLNVLEYGGVIKKRRGGGRRLIFRKISAKAPIRTAVNENQASEIRMMQNQLKREIEKEWRAIARKISKARLSA